MAYPAVLSPTDTLADMGADLPAPGTLDADRYARTVQRLQAEIANRQAEIQQAEARQAREAEQGSRRDRLMDVLRNGPAILASADPTAANVWLRTHLRVWVHERRVLIVEWL